MALCKLKNVFELVVPADVSAGSISKRWSLAALSARLATCLSFPILPGCARCVCRGERCYPRALQSTTRQSAAPASFRSSSASSFSCSETLCIRNASSVPHYFPAASRCSTLYRQARNPKKMQLNARNTSTRGLLTNDHLQIISIATLASHVQYHTVTFMLTPCAPLFRRTCADGAAPAIRHVRSARVRLLHAHSTDI